MCKILYVTDLDGTLMNSKQEISDFTANTINALVNSGMFFSYATARSNITASKITKNITAKIPIIIYNGAFILDNSTKEILLSNYFTLYEFNEILALLIKNNIYPIIYSNFNGNQKYSYLTNKINQGMKVFLDSRKGDIRDNPINSITDAHINQSFYFTCIDDSKKLLPIYQELSSKYSCVYQKDIYSGEQWLEIMPAQVNKANAIIKLKKLLKCDKIISFGDGNNDIPMFQNSDECYAVKNAVPKLKQIATDIIGSNDNDAVAKWLQANVRL